MLRLCDGLAVEFKNQFRMAGGENVRINILVTSHADVGADVKIFQVTHPGSGTVGVRPIGSRVGAQPVFSRAVAAFARDALGDFEIFAAPVLRHLVERCVTGGTARVGGRGFDVERGGNLFRARGG